MTINQDLRLKARRWLRALHRQLGAVWIAQSQDPEAVGTELALAATIVRVLDLEVFQAMHGSPYSTTRDVDRRGQVINGMTLVRNAEIHLPISLVPASNPVMGVRSGREGDVHTYTFCNATWEPYDALPALMRQNTRTAPRCHEAYRVALQGREVTETLFDALTFFHDQDPALVPRDDQGEVWGFPLEPASRD